MIRRQKTTIFTDAKDNTTVKELKQMIEGEFSTVELTTHTFLQQIPMKLFVTTIHNEYIQEKTALNSNSVMCFTIVEGQTIVLLL